MKYKTAAITFILGMLFIMTITLVDPYVDSTDYKGVKIKFYSPSVNKTQCYELLDEIPEQYLKDLWYIKFFPGYMAKKYYGYYYVFQKGVEVRWGCDMKVLVHELAHHCQHQNGDIFWYGKTHSGLFNTCEKEIYKLMGYIKIEKN